LKPELLLPEPQRQLRMRASDVELTAMGRDHRGRQVIPGHIEAVLNIDVECAGSVIRRGLPAAAPQLDPCKIGENVCRPELVALAPLLVRGLEKPTGSVEIPAHVEHVRERVRRLPQQRDVASGSRELVRPRRVCRSVGVADRAPEEREQRERAHSQRVIVEIVGQPERGSRVLEPSVESLLEAHGHREPALDDRLKHRARDGLA
jgi:hypothetical protein